MNDQVTYRRLERASVGLLLVIAAAIGLLIFESISLLVFKISLTVLLLAAVILLYFLRRAITGTIEQGKNRFKSAEFKFQKLVQSNLLGILISNYEGVVLEANDAFLNMVGYSRRDLLGSKILWGEVITTESLEETTRAMADLARQGYYEPIEKLLKTKDGQKMWVLCGSAALQKKEEGDLISFVIDITKRKEAEERAIKFERRIKTQQEEFESVFMNAPAFITIRRGSELRYEFVNKTMSSLAMQHRNGASPPSEIAPDPISLLDPEMARQVYQTGESIKGTSYKVDYLNNKGEEQVLYLDYILSPVFNHHGQVDGVAFFGNDVTELVTSMQELEVSHNKFAFLADTMPHKVWIINAGGELQYLNKAWLEFADIKSAEEQTIKWSSVIHPEEAEMTVEAWNKALSAGTEFKLESRFRRFDGQYRWHSTHAVPFKDASGAIVYWVGINTDIHDQKVQLQHLQDNEAYFRDLSEETPFIVWKSDRQGKCVYLNKKWVEITGLSLEESLGSGYMKALDIDDFDAYRQNWLDTVRNHSLYQYKFRLRTADESYRWVFCQANPHYVNSMFDGYLGSIVDITDQELTSQAIRELSERKDEFLSIASHELKTPLTSIKASIQLISRALSPDHKVSQFAIKASEQLMRLEKLISDLLDVSKINSGRLVYNNTVFNFTQMLEEVVQSVQHTTHTHRIIIEHSDTITLSGDRYRLEQVVYNFLSNAIKYSPGADKVILNSQVKDNQVEVYVRDFGIGIAPENLNKTFDRYYRVDDTAMRFQGLGLGLFISAEILKRHNGHFWVESEVGKGSCFYFSLPLNEPLEAEGPSADHHTVYKDSKLEIQYDDEKGWIEADWHGFQNFESIKRGWLEIQALLRQNQCSKVLNDNTNVLGNWEDASEWGGKVWLPAMQEAGLLYLAWVHSESTFSRMAEQKLIAHSNSHPTIRFFDQRVEAIKWLQDQKHPENIQPGTLRASDSHS